MKKQQKQKPPLCKKSQPHGTSQPEIYRIKVAGVLDPDWSDRLGGLSIQTRGAEEHNEPVTRLEGHVRDQAQLFGILNTLSDLRYKLLSVKIVTK